MLSCHPSAEEFHINGVYLFIALESEPDPILLYQKGDRLSSSPQKTHECVCAWDVCVHK